jgi:hypothetical protein
VQWIPNTQGASGLSISGRPRPPYCFFVSGGAMEALRDVNVMVRMV